MISLRSFANTHEKGLGESYDRFILEFSEEYLKYCNITYEKYVEFIYSQYKKENENRK